MSVCTYKIYCLSDLQRKPPDPWLPRSPKHACGDLTVIPPTPPGHKITVVSNKSLKQSPKGSLVYRLVFIYRKIKYSYILARMMYVLWAYKINS